MVHAKRGILIVDDDSAIRASLTLLCKTIGYSVRSAEDGLAALRRIRQEPPDMLLSDLHMPGMSGFELLSIVRRQFPAIHTIAMSSAFFGSEVPATVEADAFYEKASNMGGLLQLLTTPPKVSRPAPQAFLRHELRALSQNHSAGNYPSLVPEKSEGSEQNSRAGVRGQSESTLDS